MTEHGPPVCEVVMWKRPLLALLLLGSGTLVWYYCGPLQRNALSLFSDVLLTFVCSLGLLGVLSRHFGINIPVDPLEWQVSPVVANDIAACLANTIGAAEGVLRVAASGSDSKLFSKPPLSFLKNYIRLLGTIVIKKGYIVEYDGSYYHLRFRCTVCISYSCVISRPLLAWFLKSASDATAKILPEVVAVLYIVSAVGRAASGATVAYIVLWFMFLVPLGISKLSPEGSSNTPTFLPKMSTVLGNCTPGDSPRSTFSSPQRVNFS